MKKIYITGISGSGKSAISEELNKKGIYSIDIDSSKYGLCNWKNKKTKENVYFEHGMSNDWMKAHGWYCDVEKLKELFDVPNDIVVAVGITTNQNEYLNMFDKVFLLQCSEKTILNRLDTRISNDFGKHPLEKEHVLDFYGDFEKDLIARGAIPINTEESLDVVVSNIISNINI
jgi:dephospho-CoA kinase